MSSITIPDVPASGADLEDYVAALFQSAGFFVEKNIVERTDPGSPVLELDGVATSYAETPAQAVLIEAKGGDWGYAACLAQREIRASPNISRKIRSKRGYRLHAPGPRRIRKQGLRRIWHGRQTLRRLSPNRGCPVRRSQSSHARAS